MGLDIRLPIGLMFAILGPLLIVTGITDDTAVNIYTGGAMAAFGVSMLVVGVGAQRRAARMQRKPD